jgi:transcriptional regulator with XRE-family HTH domain
MLDDLKIAIGNRIRATREARPRSEQLAGAKIQRSSSMTREELAEAAGVSVRYLASLESGAAMPTIETLVSIARALEVPIQRLLAEPDPKGEEHEKAMAELVAVAEQQDARTIRGIRRVVIAMVAADEHT